MNFLLKYVLLIQIMIGQASLSAGISADFIIAWIKEQQQKEAFPKAQIVDEPVFADESVFADELVFADDLLVRRQNALAEISRTNTLVVVSRDISYESESPYDDAFDKLWRRQEQKHRLRLEKEEKILQLKKEQYYQEPARKRHRTEK